MPDTEDTSALRANLQRMMLDLGLNRTSLAREAGLGRTAVRDILSGKSGHPTEKTLGKLAARLSCTIDDLVGTNVGARPITKKQETAEDAATEPLQEEFIVTKRSGRGRMWLHINQEVTMDQFTRIMDILEEDD